MITGTVSKLKLENGYFFVDLHDGQRPVFCHARQCAFQINHVQLGETVTIDDLDISDRGRAARHVYRPNYTHTEERTL
jgi:cold shock CspA family protein